MTNCTACEKELTGGVDTFGEFHLPMCQDCWFDLGDEPLEKKTIGALELGAERKAPQYAHGAWFAVGEKRP